MGPADARRVTRSTPARHQGSVPMRVRESVSGSAGAAAGRPRSTMRHENGSISSVVPPAGDRMASGERIEVFGGGRTAVMDDWNRILLWSDGRCTKVRGGRDKGHAAEVHAFLAACRTGGAWPISWPDLYATTWASFAAVRSLKEGEPVWNTEAAAVESRSSLASPGIRRTEPVRAARESVSANVETVRDPKRRCTALSRSRAERARRFPAAGHFASIERQRMRSNRIFWRLPISATRGSRVLGGVGAGLTINCSAGARARSNRPRWPQEPDQESAQLGVSTRTVRWQTSRRCPSEAACSMPSTPMAHASHAGHRQAIGGIARGGRTVSPGDDSPSAVGRRLPVGSLLRRSPQPCVRRDGPFFITSKVQGPILPSRRPVGFADSACHDHTDTWARRSAGGESIDAASPEVDPAGGAYLAMGRRLGQSLRPRALARDQIARPCAALPINYADPAALVDRRLLAQMTRLLEHRGPDDEGLYLDGSLGLGNRRLAIVDLRQTGHQPMTDESSSCWLTYNGEFYNHRDFRPRLIAKGARFRGTSDTETLLHLLKDQGPGALASVAGIFALAFWDASRRRLISRATPLGVKQRNHDNGSRIVFASEIKALLACGDAPRDIDLEAVNEYLHFHTPLFDRTFFKNVRQVCQGEYLDVGRFGVHRRRYWTLDGFDPREETPAEAVSELRHLLDSVVGEQLMGDVPVGCFFSGGIDSTAVAAFARRNGVTPRCFGVHFVNQGVIDEAPYQRAAAKALGVPLELTTVNESSFADDLLNLTYYQDQPVIGPALIPMYHVSRLASRQVKVCLGGQGADELFAGYARHALTEPGRAAATMLSNLARGDRARVGGNLIKQLASPRTLARLTRRVKPGEQWTTCISSVRADSEKRGELCS